MLELHLRCTVETWNIHYHRGKKHTIHGNRSSALRACHSLVLIRWISHMLLHVTSCLFNLLIFWKYMVIECTPLSTLPPPPRHRCNHHPCHHSATPQSLKTPYLLLLLHMGIYPTSFSSFLFVGEFLTKKSILKVRVMKQKQVQCHVGLYLNLIHMFEHDDKPQNGDAYLGLEQGNRKVLGAWRTFGA